MKNIILNFKQTIRFIVSIIISREFAVIYCILGTVAQVSHTYFLIESISSLAGTWRAVQATFISIFISSSLLYFVAIADDSDKSDDGIKEYKRVNFAITLFTFIEIIINIYYYTRHLLIDQEQYQILDFVFAILVSCLIPITIKLYSSHIRAKDWILDIEHDKNAFVDSSIEKTSENHNEDNLTEEAILELIKPFIKTFESELEIVKKQVSESSNEFETTDENKLNELIASKLDEVKKDIDTQISSSFNKNQELYLNQFQNKIKLMTTEYLNNIKNSNTPE
jgi:hypothetical protein